MRYIAVAPVILACCVTAYAAERDNESKTLKALQGSWAVVSVTASGRPQTVDEKSNNLTIQIKLKVLSFKYKGAKKSLDMKLKIDPTTKPKSIDLRSTTPNGKTALGIFEVADGKLKLCWAPFGKSRPKSFATKANDGHMSFVLRRRKSTEPARDSPRK